MKWFGHGGKWTLGVVKELRGLSKQETERTLLKHFVSCTCDLCVGGTASRF